MTFGERPHWRHFSCDFTLVPQNMRSLFAFICSLLWPIAVRPNHRARTALFKELGQRHRLPIGYPWIERLPHLDGGLVTSQEAAMETFKDLVAEIEDRYARITGKATPNIDRYNAKVPADQRLPRIYLFHDEMGDWMADKDNKEYREAVESYVARLGMKARAAGIHLFLITQRPDAAALPGPLKANMNNKICLRVSSQTNSRIVLDENGAERLLGSGHLVAKLANERPSNQSSLIYAQAPFLDDDDAFDLAGAIAEHWNGR
jgi:DNA segregation ATPase FtsK/SpoIIIE, S-DNA-T family